MNSATTKNPGGRPPKFREPRRPVTMTLPVRILDRLSEIDADRAQAVVKATEAVLGGVMGGFKPVELVAMAPGESLIVVCPSRILRSISWLRMIEITPARFLLTVPSGTPIEALEVALRDLAHDPALKDNAEEAIVLNELIHLIGHQRRRMRLSKAEILIVGTD